MSTHAIAPFTPPPGSLPLPLREAPPPTDAIDVLKALASQLIVLHHLVLYGPLREALGQLAPQTVGWLRADGRLAVQVFLVVGGYLAAGSLWRAQQRGLGWGAVVVGRWQRLVRPYALALLAAMLAAWAARALVAHADTPAAPTLAQLLAHLVMLHDVLGLPALSAGVWYVAIDLQLYALGAAVFALAGRALPLALLAGVAAALLGFNLQAGGDVWAPYFFGSWGLGACAWWLRAQRGHHPAAPALVLALATLVLLALGLAWRERVVLAAAVAACLLWAPARIALPGWLRSVAARLAHVSYGVFLMHYPVLLLVGALAAAAGLTSPLAAGLAMGAGWALSLLAGAALTGLSEAGPVGARRALGLKAGRRPAPAAVPALGPLRPAPRGW